MSTTNQSSILPLSDRDEEILLHVARYRVSVYEVLKNKFFPDHGPTAPIKVVNRLCRQGFLKRIPLYGRKCGFVLTSRASKTLGASWRRDELPGPQSLPIDFAVLMYATTRKQRRRLTRLELASLFPWVTPALASLPHCTDNEPAGRNCLELIRVDLGGTPEHVARKCFQDIAKRRDRELFGTLLREGRFKLVVITTAKEKAAAIQKALDRHAWPDGLAIHLVVLPQLAAFLGRTQHAP
jgi:hypothetical protein